MEKLRKIVSALINPETILYLVFGVLTTAVNIGLYGLLREALHWPLMLSNTLALGGLGAVCFPDQQNPGVPQQKL